MGGEEGRGGGIGDRRVSRRLVAMMIKTTMMMMGRGNVV
jgi:hypothetical protein